MQTLDNLKRLQEKVEYCLDKYPHTRNNDIELLRYVWAVFYGIVFGSVTKEQMLKLPTQESMKRLRARFNEKLMYMPTDPKVWKKRKLDEELYTEVFGKKFL